MKRNLFIAAIVVLLIILLGVVFLSNKKNSTVPLDQNYVDEEQVITLKKTDKTISLESLYFNNPSQPTGNKIQLIVSSFENNQPQIEQLQSNLATLKYTDFELSITFTSEGFPTEYTEELTPVLIESQLVNPLYRLDLSTVKNLKEEVDATNNFVYTNNLNSDCGSKYCSNNQIAIAEKVNLNITCTPNNKGAIASCDEIVRFIKVL